MSVVQVSPGVAKEILTPSGGQQVKKGDKVTVHCTGKLRATGNKFWSTKDPGQEPFSFKVGLGQVIAGWDEGCLSMKKGEFSRLIINSDKGYGPGGFPAWGITPNADLIFEIEILNIESG